MINLNRTNRHIVLITKYVASLFEQLVGPNDVTSVDALMQPTKWTIHAPADALILLGYHIYHNKERKVNFKYIANQFCGINCTLNFQNEIVMYRLDYPKLRRKNLIRQIQITQPKPWPEGWTHNTSIVLDQIFGLTKAAPIMTTGFHDLDKNHQFEKLSKLRTA